MADYTGQRFGNYRLISLLGRGGYAQVYLGEQIFLKTQAAVKVMNAPLEDEKVEQFRAEAGIIARLDHPHIVRLLDYGVEKNIPYLVMAYAPNGTLRQRHPQGTPVPLAVVVRYVQQVASALDYAHQHKIIHRDIKPENLLLGRRNEVLLSDFGIAIAAHQAHTMPTQDGVGTVAYVAPEQLRRKPLPASDQYALAVLVYEWLTGDVPFQGTPIEVAMQHLEVPPPSMRQPGSSIPAAVERVVFRALEKHWQMRYASMREFALALQEASFPRPPFTRVSEGEMPLASPAQIDPLDLATTAEPPAPAITSKLPESIADDIAEQETRRLGSLRPARAAVAGAAKGEHPTIPPRRLRSRARPPGTQRSTPRHLTRRMAMLGMLALLLIAGLGISSLLLVRGMMPAPQSIGTLSTSDPTQGTPPGAAPSPTPSATPTARATPSASATPRPSPTQTPPGSPTPTATSGSLTVSPNSLMFVLHNTTCSLLGNPPKTLTLQNTGDGTLSWQATVQNTNYLIIDRTRGTLAPGDTSQVNVTVTCPGKNDSITFSWPGGSFTVAVTVS